MCLGGKKLTKRKDKDIGVVGWLDPRTVENQSTCRFVSCFGMWYSLSILTSYRVVSCRVVSCVLSCRVAVCRMGILLSFSSFAFVWCGVVSCRTSIYRSECLLVEELDSFSLLHATSLLFWFVLTRMNQWIDVLLLLSSLIDWGPWIRFFVLLLPATNEREVVRKIQDYVRTNEHW